MQNSFSIGFPFIFKNLHTIEGQGAKIMEKQDELEKDIREVDRILKEKVGLSSTNKNQIRLFLNGNETSHLFAKCALKYPSLWGKYPKLTNIEIESSLHLDLSNPIDPHYRIFQNVQHAKKFTEKDLESLANWDVIPEALKKNKVSKHARIDGRDVSFGSEAEWKTYLGLKSLGLIASFRAQHLSVPYASYIKGSKNYYPDFVFLTPEGYIAIVESKPITLMSSLVVEAKYHFLKKFCETNGYLYAMMDENLKTIEDVREEELPKKITEYADHLLATARIFDDGAFNMFYLKFKDEGYTQKELKTILSKHWIQRELVNKSSKGFLIKKRRKINYDLLEKVTKAQPSALMSKWRKEHGKNNR
jgi:hypothetical protein